MNTVTIFLLLAQAAPVPAVFAAPWGVAAPAQVARAPQWEPAPVATPAPLVAAGHATRAPAAWLGQDPADSLYRASRRALNGGDYQEAARLFAGIRQQYPSSGYVPDSYYWEAYARERSGSTDDLRQALALLDRQRELHPEARTVRDARSLTNRVLGALARQGDADAARRVAEEASSIAPPAPPGTAAPPPPVAPAAAPRPPRSHQGDCDEDDDERLMALNALINMRSDQALPILRRVLERRDAQSVCLRRKAVFLVSQKEGPEIENLLLDAARNDPDAEVREKAVFWLSQVDTDRATDALDSILQQADDRQLLEKAIFSLSQQRSPRAGEALRRFLERPDTDDDLKEQVVFWLGQRDDDASHAYLRAFYTRATSRAVKEKIIFSVAQHSSEENADWLLSLAENEVEDTELRGSAIFWAGQMGAIDVARLGNLYGRLQNREIKKKVIFTLAQSDEPGAAEALIVIARTETDPDLRKNAIFWLGQSGDPRAAEYLLELIGR